MIVTDTILIKIDWLIWFVLLSAAPPKILGLTVEGSEQSGFRAVCQVQGSPLPDVKWLSTVDSLEIFLAGSVAQEPERNHHIVSQLTNVAAGQQYTCSTSNPLGRDQPTLDMVDFQAQLSEPGAPPYVFLLITVSLVVKVLLLVEAPIKCHWRLFILHIKVIID